RILQHAIRLRDNAKKLSSKDTSAFTLPYDTVWVVFDRDDTTQEHLDSVWNDARSEKINVAFSQPCFELWLLLHYFYSEKECSACKEVGKELLKHDSKYSKSSTFAEYMPNIADAIKNSQRLHKFAEEQDIKAKSYTTVYKLIEELRKYAD
ncbi:MAG: RloB family protein, partial [Holophagales bacterium]|nr:RloB family protein [Holophagales bacterium]